MNIMGKTAYKISILKKLITMNRLLCPLYLCLLLMACNMKNESNALQTKVNDFKNVTLTTDLSILSDKEKQMIPLLISAAEIMDELFWKQAYGDKEELFSRNLTEAEKSFIKINYGPWERLNNNKAFIKGYGAKPKGANFYPADMTDQEFNLLNDTLKTSLYSVIRRTDTGLIAVPYSAEYNKELKKAAYYLNEAAMLAENKALKKYLQLRAEALLSNNYYKSDVAWMMMKDNTIDFIVGPIENYEDKLYGYKAAFEAYLLVKDQQWSEQLKKYSAILPQLQKQLPVNALYKAELPGTDSELNAYDVIYYAGDCNAGSKTIAINLPNDERVQNTLGSRRLQLKNAMQAKFEHIVVPIANELIVPEQRKHVQFNAFFENTMFHEVAHGLGIKYTIGNGEKVRKVLKDKASILEEGKADILGLFLVTQLNEMGVLQVDLMDNYVTFMAGIFRSVRFGAASSHGMANLIRYNYFKKRGAFYQTNEGYFSIDFEKMQAAMYTLSKDIITIQGDGDYQKAADFINKFGNTDESLETALSKISRADIPVDIMLKQGLEVLGYTNLSKLNE